MPTVSYSPELLTCRTYKALVAAALTWVSYEIILTMPQEVSSWGYHRRVQKSEMPF